MTGARSRPVSPRPSAPPLAPACLLQLLTAPPLGAALRQQRNVGDMPPSDDEDEDEDEEGGDAAQIAEQKKKIST